MEVEGLEIEVSKPDKVLFPGSGITKMDMVEYYIRIAEKMLPHSRGRPISMHRFPDGIEGEGFYQKEMPDYFPDWVTRGKVRVKDEETQDQVVLDSAATLAYVANLACITPHTWLSRVDHLENPDKLVFDLDPQGDDFGQVREGALLIKQALEVLDARPFVMTTGSRGLHVAVPLEPKLPFDEVRNFARRVATALASLQPDLLTVEVRKDKRKGRVFVDYLRNAYAQTSVVPYALRALEGAPVATPLDWSELDPRLGPRDYTLTNIFRRLGQKDDPWKDFFDRPFSIKLARERLESLDEFTD